MDIGNGESLDKVTIWVFICHCAMAYKGKVLSSPHYLDVYALNVHHLINDVGLAESGETCDITLKCINVMILLS